MNPVSVYPKIHSYSCRLLSAKILINTQLCRYSYYIDTNYFDMRVVFKTFENTILEE